MARAGIRPLFADGSMIDNREPDQLQERFKRLAAELQPAQGLSEVGSWFFDPAVGIPEWSDEVYRIYERDPALGPILLPDFPEIHSPAQLEKLRAAITAAKEDGTPYSFEQQISLPSGSEKWIYTTCKPLSGKGPAGHRLIGAVQDITAYKHSQSVLAEALLRQREAVKAGNVGLWDWDLKTDTVRYSAEWKRQIGYHEHEIGDGFHEWESRVHPEDLPVALEKVKQALHDRAEAFHFEFRFRHRDGTYRWILSQGSVFADDDNEPFRTLGSHIDITERKHAEEALRESEQFLSRVIDENPFPIWIGDSKGTILQCNRALLELLQLEEDQLVGKYNIQEDPLIQEHREGIRAIFEKGETWTFEVQWEAQPSVGADSPLVVIAGVVFPIFNQQGEIVNTVATYHDITESKLLEERLRRSEKMDAIGQLAGGIAHDFNNILQGMMGFASIIKDELDLASIHRFADRIVGGGERAARLIDQIRTFSLQEPEKEEAFLPQEVLQEATALLRGSLPSTIIIHEDIQQSCPAIYMDPVRFHQIAMNLGLNAFHAMEKTGGTLSIRLHEIPDEKTGETRICLQVADTGRGMSDSLQARIFEPYFSTRREEGGSGMGLAVVHGIVNQFNGTISVKSSEGEGATFTVTFPAIAGGPDADTGKEAVKPRPAERKGHILLVDDDESALEVASIALQKLGYTATSYQNPADACAAFSETPDTFDLLVTDQTMPELTGLELARKVHEQRPDLPVILCTGNLFRNSIDDPASRIRYMGKPFDFRDLHAAIQEMIASRP